MTRRAATTAFAGWSSTSAVGLGVGTFGANTPSWDYTACAPGTYPGTGPCAINPDTGMAQRNLDAHWDAITGVVGASWTPTPTILGYAKYSRGYKAGGFNSGINAVDPLTSEETVDAFEIGYKQTFAKVFQANVAAFYYNYKNDQQPLGELDPQNIINTIIVNLPEVHTYGVELEAIWTPITDLNFILNYAYLNATIHSTNGVCYQDAADPNAACAGREHRWLSGRYPYRCADAEHRGRNAAGLAAREGLIERDLYHALQSGVLGADRRLYLEGSDIRLRVQSLV